MSPTQPSGDPNILDISPARVRTSAADVAELAAVSARCRSTLAAAMAGHPMAWQQAGRPGFSKFVDLLHAQSERIRTELTFISENLSEAARAYEENDQVSAQRLTATGGASE
jgi:uncharacterized protein YukE